MSAFPNKQVHAGWFVLALIVSAAIGVAGWVAFVDAPPANSVLIADEPTYAAAQASPTVAQTRVAGQASVELPDPGKTSGVPQGTRTPAPMEAIAAQAVSAASPTAPTATSTTPPEFTATATPTPEPLSVYVTGAVQKPGLYQLPQGARVADAVGVAGGATTDADLEQANMAARVADEQHLVVPHKGDTPAPGPSPTRARAAPTRTPRPTFTRVPSATRRPTAEATAAPTGKININTASATLLESLPGIGPTLAARIVDYRTQHGPFATIEELELVPGIKTGLFSKVRDYVTVGP